MCAFVCVSIHVYVRDEVDDDDDEMAIERLSSSIHSCVYKIHLYV